MRKALHILGTLTDKDMRWLSSKGRVVRPNTGAIVVNEGGTLDALFIVLDGELDVRVGSPGTNIATLRAGEVIGEMSFVSSEPPSASVVARRGAVVLAIPRADLFTHMSTDPEFGMRFYQAIATFLADRLRVTVGRLGYGKAGQDPDPYRLPDDALMNIDDACVRFDSLLRSCLGTVPN